jgi:hypothetical protein
MNRLRIITLSALILALVAGGLPVTQSLAKWSRGAAVTSRKKNKKYRRRSRAWWRRYRARMRARRERIERRRRERLAAWRTANPGLPVPATFVAPVGFRSSVNSGPRRSTPAPLPLAAAARPAALLPFAFELPHNWVAPRRSVGGATTFSVRTPDGRAAGTAVVAPIALRPEAPSGPRAKTLGGVNVTTLRRTVIDRMVADGGWVTNDFVKETNGRRVFVVLAQTGAPGAPTQSLTFYFTEIDGRLYSLATNVPVEFAAPAAAGSEQFMASIRTAGARNLATQK